MTRLKITKELAALIAEIMTACIEDGQDEGVEKANNLLDVQGGASFHDGFSHATVEVS